MSAPVVETTNLRKEYRTRQSSVVAVKSLSLRIPRGGVHGFLGPNGSGKTTTIRMLLGLARASSGSMQLFGQDVPAHLPDVMGKVGAIVEQPKFFGNFSGRKNLELLADAIGVPHSRIDTVLDEVGLRDRSGDRFKSYSLGMKQRLAIAATLLKQPQLLILDEPTNGLDPAGIREIRDMIRQLGDSGVTVMLSSHILAEVQQVCDHVSIIGRGELLASGSVDEVIGESGSGVKVGLPDLESGAAVLTGHGYAVRREPGHLVVDGVNDNAAITKLLADAGQYVSELTSVRADLESVFLELTGTTPDGALAADADPRRCRAMRLFRVELRRLFSRRAVIVMMVLGALAVGAIAAGVLYENRPASAAELAQFQREIDRYNEEPFVQRRLAKCVEKTGNTERCEQRWLQTADNFYYRSQLEPAQFKPWLISMTGVVAALGLLIGATFVGADYISGSMGTQLLFEPNRRKVWLAKAGAAVVGVGLFSAVVLLVGSGAMWVFAKVWDRPIRPGLLGDYAAAGGRAVLLAAVAGLAGYALVMVTRHTAAVLGLLAVYGIAGEAVLRNVWPRQREVAVLQPRVRVDRRRLQTPDLPLGLLRRLPSSRSSTSPSSSPPHTSGLLVFGLLAVALGERQVPHAGVLATPSCIDRCLSCAARPRSATTSAGRCTSDDRRGGTTDAAPGGAQLRNTDREEAGLDQDPREDGPGVPAAAEAGEDRGPAHGLPGGRLPQHLRVLGGPGGDLPHRWRPVHPAV